MSTDERKNALLRELMADGDVDHDLLSRIAGGLTPHAPDASIKDKLLSRVRQGGRLHRFADEVAAMLDIDAERAKALLDGIGVSSNWEGSPLPDVSLYHLEGGERVQGAITGFIRIPAGSEFPDHDHTGEETVLVVQGRCRDTHDGRVLGPGDVGRMSPGSGEHSIIALPGPPLVYLAVVFEGIEIDGEKFGSDVY